MEEEDSRCKTPLLKRKQTSETCGSKAKKTADGEEKEVQTESSGEETESSEEEEEMVDCVTDSQPLTDSPLASASQLDGIVGSWGWGRAAGGRGAPPLLVPAAGVAVDGARRRRAAEDGVPERRSNGPPTTDQVGAPKEVVPDHTPRAPADSGVWQTRAFAKDSGGSTVLGGGTVSGPPWVISG
ncbi:unnamed protein product [Boreogadus saida]